MPPLFGHETIDRLVVSSSPAPGSLAIAAAGLLLAFAVAVAWRRGRSEMASEIRMAAQRSLSREFLDAGERRGGSMTDMLKVIDVLAESEKSRENAARTIARMGGPDAGHLIPPQSSNWYGSRK